MAVVVMAVVVMAAAEDPALLAADKTSAAGLREALQSTGTLSLNFIGWRIPR